MATPTLVTDLITFNDADSETGWSEIGGAMLSLDTDNYIEGAAAIGCPMRTGGLDGVYYTSGSTVDLTDKHLFVWIHINAANYLSHSSGGGARIYVNDGTDSGYWYIGGSDSAWVGKGWRQCVVDCNRAFDAGALTSVTAIESIGAAVSALTTPGRANLLIIDAIRIGTYLEVTSGTSSDPVTFQDIVNLDYGPAGSALGFVTKNPAGTYELAGPLIIGDQAGASNTFLSSVGEQVAFLDSPVASGFYTICGVEDTGSTQIEFGVAAVTGENAQGYDGTVFYSINPDFSKGYRLDFSYDISGLDINGCTFKNADTGVIFTTGTHGSSAHVVASTTFTECGQLSAGSVKVRNSIFSNTTHSGSSGAALLWTSGLNITGCAFLANTNAAASSHAIEHDTSGSVNYYGLSFAGNDYDIFLTTGGALTVNALSDSNPVTTATNAGGTVEIINAVTLEINGVETAVEPTNYVRCHIECLSGGPETEGTVLLNDYASAADGAGTYKATAVYNFSSDQPVIVRARYAGYIPYVGQGTIDSDGITVTAIWIADPFYMAP